jgi:hypothetical protein
VLPATGDDHEGDALDEHVRVVESGLDGRVVADAISLPLLR